MDGLRELLAVGLVMALLGAGLWALRRRGALRWSVRRPKAGACLVPLERLALSPQHSLHLVRVADRVLLIALHASGCALLGNFSRRELEDPAGAPR